MRWFGNSWEAPVCVEGEHVPTPVGQPCRVCDREIDDGDRGLLLVEGRRVVAARPPALRWSDFTWHDFPVHLDCLMGMTSGE